MRDWLTRLRTAALLACGLALAAVPAVGDGGPPAVRTVGPAPVAARVLRVMPLGASSTEGIGSPATAGYRLPLLQALTADGIRVDLVGSLHGGPRALSDQDHEGHSGWTLQRMVPQVRRWVAQADPDVVLLHMGTNDVNSGASGAVAAQRLDALLTEIYAAAPRVHVIVAGIWAPLPGRAAARADLARLTPALVQRQRALGRSIDYVDTSRLLQPGDFADALHANAAGYRKIAAMWATEIEDWLAARPVPSGSMEPQLI